MDLPIYPQLVREYFENLRIGIDSLWSEVKGTEIILDQRRLGHMLQMSHGGIRDPSFENDFEGLRKLLGRENVDHRDIHNANNLPVELKLLHSMLCRKFFPRIGIFDWLSSKDLALLVHLVDGTPRNLSFMMIEQIKSVVGR